MQLNNIFVSSFKIVGMSTRGKPMNKQKMIVFIVVITVFGVVSAQQTTALRLQQTENSVLDNIVDKQVQARDTVITNQPVLTKQQNLLVDDNDEGQLDHQMLPFKQQPVHQQSHYHKPSDPQFWYNLLLAAVLTITGAFCSGIGVGFCNIDKLQLQVMTMSKDPKQQYMAKTIHQVIKNHHLWLTTILVYNAIALESLPLVAHTLMPDWLAIIFSTFIVLIAAEIVPQAICTGPKKMVIAYHSAPIITIMRRILFFIIHPIAKGLDLLMGVHNHQRIQHKDFASFLTGNKILKQTQKMLLTSTLQLRCQRVIDKMIPIKKLYMFECSQILTKQKVDEMLKHDYSYVVVYSGNKDTIVGIIKVKEFALHYLKSKGKVIKAEEFIGSRTEILTVYKDTNLLEMLMLFQANSRRIAFVCDEKRKTAAGIPSIMYTKNDMIMKKKGVTIIGAVFLYHIFDEITDLEENPPQQQQNSGQKGEGTELKQIKGGLKQPLIEKH